MLRVAPMLTLAVLLGSGPTVRASKDEIAGYEPGSDVVSHNMLDLDQKEMNTHLKSSPYDFVKAKNIYTMGGNSGATAVLTVTALAADLAKGATVTQGTGTTQAAGKLKKAASKDATSITVSYNAGTCKVGGTSSPDPAKCFTTDKGSITVASTD